ncbi:hypothetical protein AAA799P11_00939 [Marine Group I thaumarchaeote SCGC AAA799-P11]|uniref:Uncharacterized protein n=1 Tax=Marine Group I thaumarchaeote SCGC AAA799-P11 TaxID=1502295 RepID=A0A087RZB4_9ARCH|nr:hypothetical protein AAA799P11_00939 [Marine Group I thaumarchaeote SCGC AAA799-P11]
MYNNPKIRKYLELENYTLEEFEERLTEALEIIKILKERDQNQQRMKKSLDKCYRKNLMSLNNFMKNTTS